MAKLRKSGGRDISGRKKNLNLNQGRNRGELAFEGQEKSPKGGYWGNKMMEKTSRLNRAKYDEENGKHAERSMMVGEPHWSDQII